MLAERRPPSRASPFMAPSPLSSHTSPAMAPSPLSSPASPAMAHSSSQSPTSSMLHSAVMSPPAMSPAVNMEPSVKCKCPIYFFLSLQIIKVCS